MNDSDSGLVTDETDSDQDADGAVKHSHATTPALQAFVDSMQTGAEMKLIFVKSHPIKIKPGPMSKTVFVAEGGETVVAAAWQEELVQHTAKQLKRIDFGCGVLIKGLSFENANCPSVEILATLDKNMGIGKIKKHTGEITLEKVRENLISKYEVAAQLKQYTRLPTKGIIQAVGEMSKDSKGKKCIIGVRLVNHLGAVIKMTVYGQIASPVKPKKGREAFLYGVQVGRKQFILNDESVVEMELALSTLPTKLEPLNWP